MRKFLALAALLLSGAVAQAQSTVTIVLPATLTAVPAPTCSPDPAGSPFGAAQSVSFNDSQGSVTFYYTLDNFDPTFPLTGSTTLFTTPISIPSSTKVKVIGTAIGYAVSPVTSCQYTITISPTGTPTYTPAAPLTSTVPFDITVNATSPGAINYCTVDGSTPVVAVSPVCTVPMHLATLGPNTLKSISKASGLTQSAVQTGVYTYNPVLNTPAISPIPAPGQTYVTSVDVTISVTDATCVSPSIFYTTNGQQPTTGSNAYSGTIHVTQSEAITAMATCVNHAQSGIIAQSYVIVQPQPGPTPQFTVPGGPYTTGLTTTITVSASPANVRYTTDGITTPNATVGTLCAAPCLVSISVTTKLQAVSIVTGFLTSGVGSVQYTITGTGPAGDCSTSAGTSGPLTVSPSPGKTMQPRATGISPFAVFFDAAGTTDTSVVAPFTAFQDVNYAWNFGDSGASGTSNWTYGSNAGNNSRNVATGAIAAHLYIIQSGGGDKTFTATLTATNAAGNVVICTAPVVTVQDPQGSNGFGGASTTCAAATTTPIAGANGCPAGATVLGGTVANPLQYSSALTGSRSGKRVLFKCGDTFKGTDTNLTGVKWSIGAYGGCEGTQTSRPIFNTSTTSNDALIVTFGSGDGRIADIDCEGAGTGGGCTDDPGVPGGTIAVTYQITIWNMLSSGNTTSFFYHQGAQWATVGVVQSNARGIGTYMNANQNNPTRWGGAVPNLDYQALMGSSIFGIGGNSTNTEVVRMGAGRLGVISNNTIQNTDHGASALKIHNGNTNGTLDPWTGIYTELWEVSDNFISIGTSSSMEIAPQNASTDERIRNFVVERNVFATSAVSGGAGFQELISGQNITLRDNAITMPGNAGSYYQWAIDVQTRASGAWPTKSNEFYNNTCNNTTAPQQTGQACIRFESTSSANVARNNLYYTPGKNTALVVSDNGAGNSVGNNTGNSSLNPSFVNATGAFSRISDYIPSANYTGGISVPVLYDAVGNIWSPAWDLGALRHAGPPSLANIVKFQGCTFEGLIATKDGGPESTGTNNTSATRLTLFDQYVALIGNSNCAFIGRALGLFNYAPDFTAVDANIARFNTLIPPGKTYYFGVYMAEHVPLGGPAYTNTSTGLPFNFNNMCDPGDPQTNNTCLASYTKPEYVAYMTQIGKASIDRGLQVFLFGKVSGTDSPGDGGGTVASSQLIVMMNNLKAYAAAKVPAQSVFYIWQNPSTAGGPAYFNTPDLVQGGIYNDPDGTIPNTAAVNNKGGGAPNRLWLVVNGNGTPKYNLQKLVVELDWFGDPISDSAEFACLSIPQTTQGQNYLTYSRGLTSPGWAQTPCVSSATPTRTALSTFTTNYNMLKGLGVGLWKPGRQPSVFAQGYYTPMNQPLNTGQPSNQQINFNDEGILQVGP